MKNWTILFNGFYESIHSGQIDDMLESYFSDDQGEPQEIPDGINYPVIFNAYAKEYTSAFNTYLNDEFSLDVTINFKSLFSPREYNFRTNEINAEISDGDFNLVKSRLLTDDDFIAFVNESSQSHDGFISFYNGIDAVAADDEILLQYIGRYIIDQYDDNMGISSELDTQNIHELLEGINFYSED